MQKHFFPDTSTCFNVWVLTLTDKEPKQPLDMVRITMGTPKHKPPRLQSGSTTK